MSNEKASETIVSAWLKDGFKLTDGNRGQLTGGKARAKNYTLVLYPDDLPLDKQKDDCWKDSFIQLGHKLAISPLHDKDINPDGTQKKRHYHILISGGSAWVLFSSLKELVLNDFQGKGVAVPQKCSAVDGMLRYFTHYDNADKYQYDKKDIQCFNGASIDNAYKISDSELSDVVSEIFEFVREHEDITEYFMLINIALDKKAEGDALWYSALRKESWMIERYITSRRNYIVNQEKELNY